MLVFACVQFSIPQLPPPFTCSPHSMCKLSVCFFGSFSWLLNRFHYIIYMFCAIFTVNSITSVHLALRKCLLLLSFSLNFRSVHKMVSGCSPLFCSLMVPYFSFYFIIIICYGTFNFNKWKLFSWIWQKERREREREIPFLFSLSIEIYLSPSIYTFFPRQMTTFTGNNSLFHYYLICPCVCYLFT